VFGRAIWSPTQSFGLSADGLVAWLRTGKTVFFFFFSLKVYRIFQQIQFVPVRAWPKNLCRFFTIFGRYCKVGFQRCVRGGACKRRRMPSGANVSSREKRGQPLLCMEITGPSALCHWSDAGRLGLPITYSGAGFLINVPVGRSGRSRGLSKLVEAPPPVHLARLQGEDNCPAFDFIRGFSLPDRRRRRVADRPRTGAGRTMVWISVSHHNCLVGPRGRPRFLVNWNVSKGSPSF